MRKAVVAMSGGVDSSVAAALLVERGYDVTGIMLKLWRGETANNNSGCCNLGAAEDARRVADVLGIPFYVLNFAEHFEDTVVRNFHEDYSAGRTPNPCVRCNQWVKFGALLERAEVLGADVLATGHYARVRGTERDGFRLLRGRDANKDQSYVLWMLGQRELARTLFPVGEMEKAETRRIAEELGLRTARKPDSQEICFVRDGDLAGYVTENIPGASVPGPLVDTGGNVVGEHGGVARYTIGQRKGLRVSLGRPVFVTSIDAERNTVVVGDRGDLAVGAMDVMELRFVSQAPAPGTRVHVQHRAHGEVNEGNLTADAHGARIEFDRPVEAIAPGQSAAFYSATDPDELLGGGVISATVPAAVPA
ncbi:MAG TPA: tRNA 2-thiouridine(34) synthase MnmA [Actinomycetota bacterium]|nr:tRNA 2-thiouridine(34) synthase MnmA [Actinomycetota bacterium]